MKRGKEMYNTAKSKNPLTPVFFYREYWEDGYEYSPLVRTSCTSGKYVSCRHIENSSKIGDATGYYIEVRRYKTLENRPIENSLYMPKGTGDYPTPALYSTISSPDAFTWTLEDLPLKGSIVWISFSSRSSSPDEKCVPNRFMIKSRRYAQYIGYMLRQKGVKGVFFYGDSPTQLEDPALNWGYSWDEWMELRKAFIDGYKGNKPIGLPGYKYVYEDFEKDGNKDSCILTIQDG